MAARPFEKFMSTWQKNHIGSLGAQPNDWDYISDRRSKQLAEAAFALGFGPEFRKLTAPYGSAKAYVRNLLERATYPERY